MILEIIDNAIIAAANSNTTIKNINLGSITYEQFIIEIRSYTNEEVVQINYYKGIPIFISSVPHRLTINFKA